MGKVWLFIFSLCMLIASCGSKVEIDPNMQSFMDEIKSSKNIMKPMEKFAADPAIETDLDVYELSEPTVSKIEEKEGHTCYIMNVKHGILDSNCEVCWKDGKIQSFTILAE